MVAAQVRSLSRIVRRAGVQGGEPTVRGTRVPVRAIVVAWGDSHDLGSVLAAYPRLESDDVEAALEYYRRHRADIDESIARQLDPD
jgi:uncharacterized protein (DUF433 family)